MTVHLRYWGSLATAFAVLVAMPPSARGHGSLQERIAELSRAIEAEPANAEFHLQRGELHRKARDAEAAVADYDRAEQLDPTLPGIDLCRAALALDLEDASAAVNAVDRYLRRGPETAGALELRSRALLELGRPAEALADLDRVLALDRHPRPETYLEYARVATEQGDFRAAIRGLHAGIERLGPIVSLEKAAEVLARQHPKATLASTRLGATASELGQLPPRVVELETRAGSCTGAGTSSTRTRVLLPRNSVWRYEASGTDLGAWWRHPDYDDSTWPSGPGVLGYGEPYIATTVPSGPDPSSRYVTTYFRATFVVSEDPSTFQGLSLLANYDDGLVAYLNGEEVARRSMPAGPISWGTLAQSHEGGTYETLDLAAFASWLVQGVNVLAVEVHQTTLTSSDLVHDMELVHGIRVTRGPYLQIGTPTSVVVRWRTSTPTQTRVRYGHAPGNLVWVQDDAALNTEHEMKLTGLSPDTRYYYSIGTSTEIFAGDDADHYVTTPPVPGTERPIRIWVLGDSGLPGADQLRVRDAYSSHTDTKPTHVWLMLGDNAYTSGTDGEYQGGLFDPYADFLRRTVLWPTRGNHDQIFAGGNNDYYDIFSMPRAGEAGGVPSGTEAYYSFDHGNVHFVCLDSEGSDRSPAGAMLTWLRADLTANTRGWTLAFWHHPPYTKGSHDSDNDFDSGGRMRDMRTNALPILDSLGVDLVLTGHSHSYERSLLLDRHYGYSWTLVPGMILDAGDGRPVGDGAYAKPTLGPAPHEGAVYAVAGSASQISGGLLNHPVMTASMNVLGSMVLDVFGTELTARFLDDAGQVRDEFTIVKGPRAPTGSDGDARVELQFDLAGPNPFRGETRFSYTLPAPGPVRLTVHDAAGRRVATLVDEEMPLGRHAMTWDGCDEVGRRVVPGVYFSRLEFGGATRHGKLVITH